MAINSVSFWQQNQNWRARQQDLADQLDLMSALTQKMADANAGLASGKANLVGQAVLKRVTQEAKSKALEQAAAAEKAAADDKETQALQDRTALPDYIQVLVTRFNVLA